MGKKLFVLLLLICTTISSAATIYFDFPFNGKTRKCLLFVPSSYDTSKHLPLIIAYHGMTLSPAIMESNSGLSLKAEAESFFVIYPEMENKGSGWQYSEAKKPNDIDFTTALLDSLEKAFLVDKERIYATGFSSGGFMTYKTAYKLAGRIAAIAPVAGSLVESSIIPERKVPVIHFHAKNDGSVYYSTAKPALDFWINFNKCKTEPDTILKVDGATGVKWHSSVNCDVILYATDTGQHSWPGGTASWTTPSKAISANDLMWDFFKKYTLHSNTGLDSLKYIGHSFFKLKTAQGVVVYFDPYFVNDFSDSADIVLSTHEHYDHNDISKVLRKSDALVIRSADALKSGTYQTFTKDGITIKAVPAYNVNHSKNSCVGYVVEFNGIKIYHAGDTGKITEMANLAADSITYALLPMDGTYTMNYAQAAECSEMIKAEYYIPIHTASSPPTFFVESIATQFNVPNKVLMRPGETIYLHHSLVSDVTDNQYQPYEFELMQNYPNPFNPETKIRFTLPQGETGIHNIVLKVYNILGAEVAELFSGEVSAGTHEVNFNAVNLPSGVYFYSLSEEGYSVTKKLMVLK